MSKLHVNPPTLTVDLQSALQMLRAKINQQAYWSPNINASLSWIAPFDPQFPAELSALLHSLQVEPNDDLIYMRVIHNHDYKLIDGNVYYLANFDYNCTKEKLREFVSNNWDHIKDTQWAPLVFATVMASEEGTTNEQKED